MAEMEAHNQREITQRQRAEALYGSLTCTTYSEDYQDPDNDIGIIEQALTTARQEALREASDLIKLMPMLTAHNVAAVLDRLAREGVRG